MIFENIPFKKKMIGLIALAIILFMAAKKRSYSVAYNMYSQVKEIEDKLDYIKNSTTNIDGLKKEIAAYDRIIGPQEIVPEQVQQNILDYSANFEDISIIGIEEIHTAKSNNFEIITNRLNIEGDINAQMKFLYSMEKNFAESMVSSLIFYTNENGSERNSSLKSTITFQNYDKVR